MQTYTITNYVLTLFDYNMDLNWPLSFETWDRLYYFILAMILEVALISNLRRNVIIHDQLNWQNDDQFVTRWNEVPF